MRDVVIVTGALLLGAGAAAAAGSATVRTARGCYVVGQSVSFRGSGFSPRRPYEVSIDGVDFGQAITDASGSLRARLVPGGLRAGSPQSVDRLEVTDGSLQASAMFTVTRSAGARFLTSRGDPRTLRTAFQIWGFSLAGREPSVYLHYISPSGQPRQTVSLGRVGGQCGYLRTSRIRVFPFSPSTGSWTLQVDTDARYASHPRGSVARIYVTIARS